LPKAFSDQNKAWLKLKGNSINERIVACIYMFMTKVFDIFAEDDDDDDEDDDNDDDDKDEDDSSVGELQEGDLDSMSDDIVSLSLSLSLSINKRYIFNKFCNKFSIN
jgi:hypothetical protein